MEFTKQYLLHISPSQHEFLLELKKKHDKPYAYFIRMAIHMLECDVKNTNRINLQWGEPEHEN